MPVWPIAGLLLLVAAGGQPLSPDGWDAPTVDEGRLVVSRDAAVVRDGPASLRLSTDGAAAKGSVSRPLPETAGRSVWVTGWVRVVGEVGYCAVAWIIPGGEPSFVPLAEPRPSPRWQRVNARANLPAGPNPPRLALLIQGTGDAWLDGLSVRPGEEYRADPLLTEFAAPPLFAYGTWDQRVAAGDDGVTITADTARGGCGFLLTRDQSGQEDWVPTLSLTPGAGHRARSLRVTLTDADGTVHEFVFATAGLPAGVVAAIAAADGASPRQPGKVNEPGIAAGFDAAGLRQVQVVGDWSGDAVDVALHRLELREPTAAQLDARRGLEARLAADEARRQREAAARVERVNALLAGAPHPEDGPDLRHLAAVAPDILSLTIQEKTFVHRPQEPYVAEPGDELRRTGDELPVIEAGEIITSPLEITVFRGGRRLGNLAPNAGTIKPEDTAVGADLSDETVAEPRAYRLVPLDNPAAAMIPTAVSWKRKPNAPRSLAFEVQVFLTLPTPLVPGARYRLEFPGVNLRQASVEYTCEPASQRSPAVHVSAIGFRPDDPFKRAWLSQWLGTGGGVDYPDDAPFSLLDDATGRPVYTGRARRLFGADEAESFKAGRNYARAEVLALDFGDFATPGSYRVLVDGIGCSYPFSIDADVWQRAFALSMKGLLHHRSGLALGPPFTDYTRPRNMHPADGVRVFAAAGSEFEAGGQDGAFRTIIEQRTDRVLPDAWGGHMDAGDWDRNGNHPRAVWLLLDLFERYPEAIGAIRLALPPGEADNNLPDILDEALWNLEMHRRLQTPEGGVAGGIESAAHPRPGETSWQESLVIAAFAPDPHASFVHAASAGKLARLLRPFDADLATAYRESAERAYRWAADQTEAFVARRPTDGGARGELQNVRCLAALELWLTTGTAAYHADFAAAYRLSPGGDGDAGPQIKAVLRYARVADGQGDAALRGASREWLLRMADTALTFGDGNGFGVTTSIPQLPPMGFVGYLSTPEMIFAVLPAAYELTGEAKYLAGALRATQFSAGANPMNRALTTGLGPDPVRYPLHIDSLQTGQEAPDGITVYGISDSAENYAFDAWAYTWFLQKMVPEARTWPTYENYWDIWLVPSTNEYTIHQTIIPTACYWGFLAARE